MRQKDLAVKNNCKAAAFISQAEKFNWKNMPEELRDGCYEKCHQLLELEHLGSNLINKIFDLMQQCIIP